MARKHVCQPEDELEQAVLAPRSFEGVPPHTSRSVEGRRTTIKGHLFTLTCQCLPARCSRVCLSSPHTNHVLFLLSFFFLALHFILMRKEGKSVFFCWREERLKPDAVSFASGKLAEIEGFG